MNAERSHPSAGLQAISAKLWSAGFLSPEHAGVGLQTGDEPVLYLKDPARRLARCPAGACSTA